MRRCARRTSFPMRRLELARVDAHRPGHIPAGYAIERFRPFNCSHYSDSSREGRLQ